MVTNRGLLQAMGLPIQQDVMQWSDTLTSEVVLQSSRAYQLNLFYILMPLKW